MTDQDLFVSEQAHQNKEKDLQQAKAAMAGSVPLVGGAPDPFLLLPRGLFNRGTWQKEVEVRELTGADEETLAKVKDQVSFFTTVLALGTARIGDIDLSALTVAERRFHLGQLLIGERDQIFLKIVQASFGDEKRIHFTCSRCEAENETVLLLSEDFPPQEVEDVGTVTLYHETAKGHTLDFRPAVGDDQEEALSKKGASLAEQNTLVLSRCITKVNGGLVLDPIQFARTLGMRDRQQLLEKLAARQPSISLDIEPPCSGCGSKQRLALSWGDLFRP